MPSNANPRSSGEVVMKKIEKEETKTRNRTDMANDVNRGDPVIKFMIKMREARRAALLTDNSHLRTVLPKRTNGIWAIKAMISMRRWEKSKATTKNTITIINFTLGSILWSGVFNLVNLNPSRMLIDIFSISREELL
jgi:hypothetical protein